jgi:hypothetical protein
VEAAVGAGDATTYTPLENVFGALLPRSDPATAIPTQSRRNQRNGDLVRNLFFTVQQPPSWMMEPSQHPQYTIICVPCPRINYYRNVCNSRRHFYKGSSTMTSSRTAC